MDIKVNVKLDKKIVDKVKDQKKKFGIPIGRFFEDAAMEKLQKKTGVNPHT